jgi:hypothetical protein
MPVPMAVIMVRISAFSSTLSSRAFSTLISLPRIGRMAWNRRSRPCLAEPPAESPSTMYSLGVRRVAIRTIGQFARQTAAGQGALADRFPRLARRLPGARGHQGLVDHLPRHRRRGIEVVISPS